MAEALRAHEPYVLGLAEPGALAGPDVTELSPSELAVPEPETARRAGAQTG